MAQRANAGRSRTRQVNNLDVPAWLIGSSAGGGVALDAAFSAPERVAGLVLLAPAVSGAPAPELDADTARLDRLPDQAIESGDFDQVNRLETWLGLDGPAQPEGRVGDPARSLLLDMNRIVLANGVTIWGTQHRARQRRGAVRSARPHR